MMKSGIKILPFVFGLLVMSSCVTTTTSPFDDKKDLEKAEQSYIQIGYGYFEQGNFLESKRALIKAIEINPKSSGAHMGLARVYERELEFELADDHFRDALRYGESSEVHFQYGVYLYNRGDFKGAFDEFDDALQDTVYVRRPQAFEYRGIVAERLEREEIAITSYERAIALNPTMANSFLALTKIYNNKEDYNRAYSYYRGYVNLVRAQVVRHTASTLWTGIQLSNRLEDQNMQASLELQLRNQFAKSNEYQQYLTWKAEKGVS